MAAYVIFNFEQLNVMLLVRALMLQEKFECMQTDQKCGLNMSEVFNINIIACILILSIICICFV